MKSAIEEIFYRETVNYETEIVNEEYERLHGEYDKIYQVFIEGLSDEKMKMLDDLWFTHVGIRSEEAKSRFIEGVKLGIRLGIEACN